MLLVYYDCTVRTSGDNSNKMFERIFTDCSFDQTEFFRNEKLCDGKTSLQFYHFRVLTLKLYPNMTLSKYYHLLRLFITSPD